MSKYVDLRLDLAFSWILAKLARTEKELALLSRQVRDLPSQQSLLVRFSPFRYRNESWHMLRIYDRVMLDLRKLNSQLEVLAFYRPSLRFLEVLRLLDALAETTDLMEIVIFEARDRETLIRLTNKIRKVFSDARGILLNEAQVPLPSLVANVGVPYCPARFLQIISSKGPQ
jgi:hypothetical protein